MMTAQKPAGSGRSIQMIMVAIATASLWLEGCAGSVGTTARSLLSSAQENPDPNARYEAYVKLGKKRTYDNEEQIVQATEEMSKRLLEGKEPPISRAVICRSLGQLKRPEARDALLKSLDDEDEEVRAEAARALGKVGREEDAVLLARMMAIDSTANGRVAAAEGLSELKPKDPQILVALSENLSSDDPAIRLASYNALKGITGENPGTDTNAWQEYLAQKYPAVAPETAIAGNGAQPKGDAARALDSGVKPAGATGLVPGALPSGLPPAVGPLP